MSSILFKLYGEYFMKEALAKVGDFKIGVRVINKVRFAVDTGIIRCVLNDTTTMDVREGTSKNTITQD